MKINTKIIIAILLGIFSISASHAQKVVQTLKGTVYDNQSKVTLPGATVYLSNNAVPDRILKAPAGHLVL